MGVHCAFVRCRLFQVILSCLLLILVTSTFFVFKSKREVSHKLLYSKPSIFYQFNNITLPPKKFVVYNDNCRIPRQSKYSVKIFKELSSYKKATKCQAKPVIVSKSYDSDLKQYRLQIKTNGSNSYKCCYIENFNYASYIQITEECKEFYDGFLVPKHIRFGIIVKCTKRYSDEPIYRKVFFIFNFNSTAAKLKKMASKTSNNLGILLIGTEKFSQLNFGQEMPRTLSFFKRNGWFELSGYNKVGSTSLSNILSMLTGLNETTREIRCQSSIADCLSLLQKFREHGFVTAYAGDHSDISKFNFEKNNFSKSPFDFNLTPLISVHKSMERDGITCLENNETASLIYDAATEFILIDILRQKFGVFWTKSISHVDVNTLASNDAQIVDYLNKWNDYGIFENNIFIFISNHGIHADMPNYFGHYSEKRLPAMFIWLPKFIRDKYPEFTYALMVNKYRLVSPFDIYMTLHQLLLITEEQQNELNESFAITSAKSCPTCRSLLNPMSENRTCTDAGISSHWCSCEPYLWVDSKDEIIINITKIIVRKINDFLAVHGDYYCRKLKLFQVNNVMLKVENYQELNIGKIDLENKHITLRVHFTTHPQNNEYEATFTYSKELNEINLNIKDISLLVLHENLSSCVSDTLVKRFCICFTD